MFKKTLLALAVTGAASFGASAASTFAVDLDATTVAANAASGTNGEILISAQGANGATSLNFGANNDGLNVTIEDSNDDKGFATLEYVTVTFTNATIAPASAPTIEVFEEGGNNATTGTAGDNTATIGAATVDYPGTDNNQIRFQFDAADRTQLALLTAGNANGAGSGEGFQFLVDGIALNNTLTAGTTINATVEFVSEVGATVIDSGSTAFAQMINQFSIDVSDTITDEIDVSDDRQTFVNGDQTQEVHVDLVAAAVDMLAATSAGATNDDLVVTINGDFTFLDSDSDDAVDANNVGTGYQAGGQSLVITTGAPAIVAGGLTVESDFTVTVDGERTIPTGAFTYDVSLSYNDASISDGTYTATGSVGSWTLNGSDDTLAFMPFGDAFSQSITVTNTGAVEGSITVEFQYNGTTSSETLTSVAAANAVTDISAEVRAAAATAGITGNANVNIIVNSPDADITVTGLYYSKADADRVLVPTMSN